MAEKSENIFEAPFEIDLDEGAKDYVGGGFDGGGDIPAVDETTDEDLEAEDKETEDEKKEEDGKAAPGPGTEVVDAIKGITESFGEQLANMSATFTSHVDTLTKRVDNITTRSIEAKEPPPLPTEEDWEKDPNKATQMIMDRNKALSDDPADESSSDADENAPLAGDALKTKQLESYSQASGVMPEITKSGSEERKIFERIYLNPQYGFFKSESGPLAAAFATRYYFEDQAKKEAGEADTAVDDTEDTDVAKAEKIIADARAKKHAMSRAGRKTVAGDVKISAEGKRIASQFGVSEKAYLEGVAATGNRG